MQEQRYFDYLETAEKIQNSRITQSLALYIPAVPLVYLIWLKAKGKAWWVVGTMGFILLGFVLKRDSKNKIDRIGISKPGFPEFFNAWLTQRDKKELRQGYYSSPSLAAIVADSFADGGEPEGEPITGLDEGELKAGRKAKPAPREKAAKQQEAAEASYNKQIQEYLGVMFCSNCKMKVFPKADGTCPSCRESL
jgi:hypothetical protein